LRLCPTICRFRVGFYPPPWGAASFCARAQGVALDAEVANDSSLSAWRDSISARPPAVVIFCGKSAPQVDVGDFRLNMLIPRKRELL
jgi:hypothetical protein